MLHQEHTIIIEFISFKIHKHKERKLTENNLGTLSLVEDISQLNEVIIRAEKSTVEIKLDKKSLQCWSRHACKRRNC
jgi:hypothetical protein